SVVWPRGQFTQVAFCQVDASKWRSLGKKGPERMTQWHPLFAQLLRPLLESYYEVQTGVAVGDAPRQADILLLRRTSATAPPFRGLWQRLTAWNVLEFKGPTVSARVDDLDDLLEVGLGIQRRLNEEQAKQGQPQV